MNLYDTIERGKDWNKKKKKVIGLCPAFFSEPLHFKGLAFTYKVLVHKTLMHVFPILQLFL